MISYLQKFDPCFWVPQVGYFEKGAFGSIKTTKLQASGNLERRYCYSRVMSMATKTRDLHLGYNHE